MSIKKIDWLRQLFREATKWTHSLTGQVKWSGLKFDDPNNGSRMTIKDLERSLPRILIDCLDNKQVPSMYLLEVQTFLSIATKRETFDKKKVAKLVHKRKKITNLVETLETYQKLSEVEKEKVIDRTDEQDFTSLHRVLQNFQARLQGLGILGEPIMERTEEGSKFKTVDWLRHMYLMIQKWLHNHHGQMQWKQLNAQDPNNSKDGNRMKMDELKQSLKVLVPNLEDSSVPRAYLSEVNQIREVLCNGNGELTKEILEHEASIRKIALNVVEALLGLEDIMEDIVSGIERSKLPLVLAVVTNLEMQMRTSEQVENNNLEMNEVIPDLLENENFEVEFEENPLENSNNNVHYELEDKPTDGMQVNLPSNEAESDGTEYLEEIIKQQSEAHHSSDSKLDHEAMSHNVDPTSPSSGSEVLSDVSSPASQHGVFVEDPFSDDPFSDDSGFCSPDESNPLDLEDDVAVELENVDTSVVDWQDLDTSSLPDFDLPPETDSSSLKRKRQISCESIESPALKKARP